LLTPFLDLLDVGSTRQYMRQYKKRIYELTRPIKAMSEQQKVRSSQGIDLCSSDKSSQPAT